MKRSIVFLVLLYSSGLLLAQGVMRNTYHDAAKKNLKEIYQVKDTVKNILHGRYISYFLNGSMESKGTFMNNETTGVWEFYYESGNLKMRGILRQNSNYGLWEYYYENGNKSMEGNINGQAKEGEWRIFYEGGELKESGHYVDNKRSGFWKTYFEDGVLRGEIEYAEDHGRYTEYYHSGKVLAEGPKAGTKSVGHWRFFAEDGTLNGEGDYMNGKKNGEWKYYYPSGKTLSTGTFENDEPVGEWNYFFEDGKVSSSGKFIGGKKNGYWSTFSNDGKVMSEITYANGSGDYREYYPDGKLKAKGQIMEGKNQGLWEYFYPDGKKEGDCQFNEGKGIYHGYYPNGNLQTKGQIEDNLRVGTWELYEQDGTLSGYYKPVYEESDLSREINSLISNNKIYTPPAPRVVRRGFMYFKPRFPEYRGVIVQGNPMLTFLGTLPVGIEYYNQERLGHEFVFEGIRHPFYMSDSDVPPNEIFKRGYAISIRQKFYNPTRLGMWYFAHEIKFTNMGHYSNVVFPPGNKITASASEQRVEYGVLLGTRLMQKNNGDGFTIDAFAGYGAGYRNVDVESIHEATFGALNKNSFAHSIRIGLNFGYSFSFE